MRVTIVAVTWDRLSNGNYSHSAYVLLTEEPLGSAL